MSKLEKYRLENNGLTFNDFIELDENEAVSYDFIRNGGEPDECSLSIEIYKFLYPWYNHKDYRGDTMNTYRKLIHHKYGKYFFQMNESQQQEILLTIRGHTLYVPEKEQFIFAYEKKNSETSEIFDQICNNYQLGNFIVFPRGKINLARSQAPYNDYFDRFLSELKNYYDCVLKSETRLQKEIKSCEWYFKYFSSFDDYVEKNYLQDFFQNGEIIQLFTGDFEEYVCRVNKIIQLRGRRLYNIMQNTKVAANGSR